MRRFKLNTESAFLLIVDIQENLAAVMSRREEAIKNNLFLIELAKLQGIPVLISEQYSKGLGPTVSEISGALPDYNPVEKLTFDCCATPSFGDYLDHEIRNTAIITGMETHICVLQTALGLLGQQLNVHVVSDGVCSRTKNNWKAGISFMRDAGAVVTSTEIVLFQLLGVAGTEEFKAISRLVK
ncbi:MAG: isochorismatase family protein [Rubrobacteridae bacterium]|nr:isochorismatase family protein [Rubrobacteridae bacterium]